MKYPLDPIVWEFGTWTIIKDIDDRYAAVTRDGEMLNLRTLDFEPSEYETDMTAADINSLVQHIQTYENREDINNRYMH